MVFVHPLSIKINTSIDKQLVKVQVTLSTSSTNVIKVQMFVKLILYVKRKWISWWRPNFRTFLSRDQKRNQLRRVRNHLGARLCALSLNQLKWKKFSPEFRTLANQNGPILPDFRRIFITSHSERPNVSHKVTYSMLSRLLNSLKNCCMRTRRNRCSILKNDRTSSFLPVGAAKAKTSTGKEATRSNGNSPLA